MQIWLVRSETVSLVSLPLQYWFLLLVKLEMSDFLLRIAELIQVLLWTQSDTPHRSTRKIDFYTTYFMPLNTWIWCQKIFFFNIFLLVHPFALDLWSFRSLRPFGGGSNLVVRPPLLVISPRVLPLCHHILPILSPVSEILKTQVWQLSRRPWTQAARRTADTVCRVTSSSSSSEFDLNNIDKFRLPPDGGDLWGLCTMRMSTFLLLTSGPHSIL